MYRNWAPADPPASAPLGISGFARLRDRLEWPLQGHENWKVRVAEHNSEKLVAVLGLPPTLHFHVKGVSTLNLEIRCVCAGELVFEFVGLVAVLQLQLVKLVANFLL